jgi:hypothetical protein
VVTVVKFVVASAVDEEGNQIHPRGWNYEFIQLRLVIKENQSCPTVTGAEISGLLNSLKERYAVLVAPVAGTGLRIGEALRQFALRILTRIPRCCTSERRLAQMRASTENSERDSTRRDPGGIGASSTPIHGRKGWLPLHDESRTAS